MKQDCSAHKRHCRILWNLWNKISAISLNNEASLLTRSRYRIFIPLHSINSGTGFANPNEVGLRHTHTHVLQPIFDPHFHPSSYGYRPNRSAARAVAKAERFSKHYGLSYVVDMDISKCFDSLDHNLILQGVNKRVADGSVRTVL